MPPGQKSNSVMITGDHILTACAIAKDLRHPSGGDLTLTGKELDEMSDGPLTEWVAKVSVFPG